VGGGEGGCRAGGREGGWWRKASGIGWGWWDAGKVKKVCEHEKGISWDRPSAKTPSQKKVLNGGSKKSKDKPPGGNKMPKKGGIGISEGSSNKATLSSHEREETGRKT